MAIYHLACLCSPAQAAEVNILREQAHPQGQSRVTSMGKLWPEDFGDTPEKDAEPRTEGQAGSDQSSVGK